MEVKVIPAKPVINYPRPLRVAAYCRVSTQQEIQHHSLEVQEKYYGKYINGTLNWTFVGIYAEQTSGRHHCKMREFQRMMDDCRTGKIDYILVKSISRLGRNTLQFLQACDELKALGVDVYFEVEKLHINDPQTVRMLTLYASLYQNESETKSFSIRWGFRVRFNNGSAAFYNRPCYGYCKTEDGTLEIVPEEAAVVCAVFEWRDQGASLRDICRKLNEADIPAPRGGSLWHVEAIRRILNNEKYYGDVCLQKTYIADYFTGKQVPNNGEYERFVIKNHHKAIITKNEPKSYE